MKIYLKIFAIVGLFVFTFSCEQDPFIFDVNCDECYYPEPDTADLILDFTLNEENPYVPYILYIGDVEDNIVIFVGDVEDNIIVRTAYSEQEYLPAAVNEHYSIEAFYKNGDQTVVVVDGDKLKTSRTSEVCDTECWIIKGGQFNLKLKQ